MVPSSLSSTPTPQTLGEAFERCDIAWLTAAVIRFHSGWSVTPEALGGRRFKTVEKTIAESLACMELLDEGDAADAPCYLPRLRYDRAGRKLTCAIDYLCCDATDLEGLIAEVGEALERSGPLALGCRDAFGDRLAALDAVSRQRLTRDPWPRLLAGRIAGAAELSPFEWHGFLAALYWAMTTRGFTPPLADVLESAPDVLNERPFDGRGASIAEKPPPSKRRSPNDAVASFESTYDETIDRWVERLNGQSCGALALKLADGNPSETMECEA